VSGAAFSCYKCGKPAGEGRVEFRALCPGCSSYLHCCLNCKHYDPAIHHECRASATTEYCAVKDIGNFCEEFIPGSGSSQGGKTKSRAEIEKLFPDLP